MISRKRGFVIAQTVTVLVTATLFPANSHLRAAETRGEGGVLAAKAAETRGKAKAVSYRSQWRLPSRSSRSFPNRFVIRPLGVLWWRWRCIREIP